MPITHFKILEIPDPLSIISRKRNGPITLDHLYPIAEQNELNFKRSDDLASSSATARFKYILYDSINDFYGNEAYGNINWFSNGEVSGTNGGFTILNEKTKLSRFLLMTPATEFIVPTEINGVNIFWIYHEPEPSQYRSQLFVGQNLSMADFMKTYMVPEVEGGGHFYSQLKYKVGGIVNGSTTIFPEEYTATVNIDSLAEMTFSRSTSVENKEEEFIVGGIPTMYNVKRQKFFIQIRKGFHTGVAKVRVNIDSPFLEMFEDNQISIFNGVSDTVYQTNGIFDIDIALNNLGVGLIEITNMIVENNTDPKLGVIGLELISINNFTDKVSSIKTLTLNTNFL